MERRSEIFVPHAVSILKTFSFFRGLKAEKSGPVAALVGAVAFLSWLLVSRSGLSAD